MTGGQERIEFDAEEGLKMIKSEALREVVYTVDEKCVGCNKCIRNCPVAGANISYLDSGESKVRVDQDKCIRCGACIAACAHEARQFVDDTELFFSDLAAGKKISVVAAPAARTNFDNHRKLIGYLKAAGVNLVYDVSFGADITTWAYLKAIREKNLKSVIAQPCPAIVNYIEKYKPELLVNLAPVHSPTLCTAVYLKKYIKTEDRIAFLSPCIGKTDEFIDPNTNGYVSYNVTYRKLHDYIKAKGIDLAGYPDRDFDDIGCWLGCVYSRPGGLRENVEELVKGAWVRQIEGPGHAYSYLGEYARRLHESRPLPLLVDILNCSHGCNIGTATRKHITIDDADLKLNAVKSFKLLEKTAEDKLKSNDLFEMFDRDLSLSDFLRTYRNRKVLFHDPNSVEIDGIYRSLHKYTDESRKVDCSACGYETCEQMAHAIFNGYNTAMNCIRYNQHEMQLEAESIRDKTKIIDRLSAYTNEVVAVLDEVANLNLDVEVQGDFEGEFGAIKDSINLILGILNNTLTEIKVAAEQFDTGAEQVAQGSNSLAAGAIEQSAAVEKLSGLITMLTDKARMNTSNASKAKGLSFSATEAAEDGNRRMGEMLKSMAEINTASENINKILKTIDDIAFQTNILALNAAVEAARAGKYGKGFAVVADEVRNLANKCSVAAKESGEFIEESVKKIRAGTKIANDTASVLATIRAKSGEIAGLVEMIAAASDEQSHGIETINVNLQQVSHVVQSNSETSQESAATSEELSSQAVSLRDCVGQFVLREYDYTP